MQVFINDSEYDLLVLSLYDQMKEIRKYSLKDAITIQSIIDRIDKCYELQSKKKTANQNGQR